MEFQMPCLGEVPVAVLTTSSFARGGLISFLAGTRFQVMAPAAGTYRTCEPVNPEPVPLIILAVLEDRRSTAETCALRGVCADSKLIILSRADFLSSQPDDLYLTAEAVLGYDIDRETLIKVLDIVMSGMKVQSDTLLPWLLNRQRATCRNDGMPRSTALDKNRVGIATEERPSGCFPLSSRERDVLRCLAEGLSNKQIAQRLCISDSTVKDHVRSAKRKLKTRNRTQAALWALDRGLHRK
jgi:two-component system nitrate/nitrite response regulator NarL